MFIMYCNFFTNVHTAYIFVIRSKFFVQINTHICSIIFNTGNLCTYLNSVHCMHRGEEGQSKQFLVRATFSLFSRPSHRGSLVLRFLRVLKFQILEDKIIIFLYGRVKTYYMDRLKYCNNHSMLESLNLVKA